MMMDIDCLQQLTDDEVLTATRKLIEKENRLNADLILYLAEIDARRLFLGHAYPSMFAFCLGELGFSEDVAYQRIAVARLARRFSLVIEILRSGRVHLAGLRLLAPVLTEENHRDLLAEAARKTKRQIEEIVARVAPQPPAPTIMRKLAGPKAATPAVAATNAQLGSPAAAAGLVAASVLDRTMSAPPSPPFCTPSPTAASAGASIATAAPSVIKPLAEDRFRIQFTGSRSLRDKLREAQDLLRHQVRDGDLGEIVERAIERLILDVKKKRFGVGRKPRAVFATVPVANGEHSAVELVPRQAKSGGPAPRRIPDAIKRAVYERDGGRCTFADERGRRCEETGTLEFDHEDGFANSGTHSVDRIRVRCRAHNAHAADLMYGREFMARVRRAARLKSSAPVLAEVAPDAAANGAQLSLAVESRNSETPSRDRGSSGPRRAG